LLVNESNGTTMKPWRAN